MKISQAMSRTVHSILPTESMVNAARMMADHDIGALPVVEDGELVGMVTDRDIAIRGVATSLNHGAPVLRVMSQDVRHCREDDDVDDVLEIMSDEQIRRIPVCSGSGELVGMFTIGDAAREADDKEDVSETLSHICRPHGRHSQTIPVH
ncbi:CBS domain-containing protein [Sphingomonas sp. LaA6.9]|uniref:CBS domain-containing protein n=1 Tax=Sphingomonas sp. LaA6.9 TaxID=2919914 RepID=UPI001F4F669D|nr:CBS domain-containing protein [Sphingomonas sp. LaA6.9]MCJ8156853.1 CBS domain-containing protein [Sphingomonas sp. LaA6.9]